VKHALAETLEQLEAHYGAQTPCWPVDPYLFLIWWHCGYPASDAACARGWKALTESVGTDLERILAASNAQLTRALKAGGMVPEKRAMRLKQIVARVLDECGGDLRGHLMAAPAKARKVLRKFPNIGDPGADRILLFAGIEPVAAVPSNCPHVLVRIQRGPERLNYGLIYRDAKAMIEAEIAESFDARQRAYLLLKRHGQEVCKRTKPACAACSIRNRCTYFASRKQQ
jgi:endonuclease-3